MLDPSSTTWPPSGEGSAEESSPSPLVEVPPPDGEASAAPALPGHAQTAASDAWLRELAPLDKAAAYLSRGEPREALATLDAERASSPVEGPRASLIRARSFTLLRQPDQAVMWLERAADFDAHAVNAKVSPPEVVPGDLYLSELAIARFEWVSSAGSEGRPRLSDDDRQRQLALAAQEIKSALSYRNVRNRPQLRVLEAQVLGAMRDAEASADIKLAKVARARYDKVLADYPNHPTLAALQLDRARLMVREGRAKDAGAAFAAISFEHAGSVEAAQAANDLAALKAIAQSVVVPNWTQDQQLERAQLARAQRRYDASRGILDELLARPELSGMRRSQALASLSWTAYKQRDWARCVSALEELRKTQSSYDHRVEQARCLERGQRHDEAVDLLMEVANDTKARKGIRGAALWAAIEHAHRGGLYERAWELLDLYESAWLGHVSERAVLRPMLAHLTHRDADALVGFARLAERSASQRTMARYYVGKLSLRSEDVSVRDDGEAVLRSLIASDPYDYYALWARRQLVLAGLTVDPLPRPAALSDEQSGATYAQASEALVRLAQGPLAGELSLGRAAQLHAVGWLEEERRELRWLVDGYLNSKSRAGGGSDAGSTRSESLEAGISWRAEWSQPRPLLGSGARKIFFDEVLGEQVRQDLRVLARALDDGNHIARLSAAVDAPSAKARWSPRPYRGPIEREASLREIEPNHLWALMYTESRFRRHVVSPVGARGALQIMPSTARQLVDRLGGNGEAFNPDDLYDIEINSQLAAYYVAELLKNFDGQAPMAYASYNGGPDNVARWLLAATEGDRVIELDDFVELIPLSETYRYTKRVMEIHALYELIYSGQEPLWPAHARRAVRRSIEF